MTHKSGEKAESLVLELLLSVWCVWCELDCPWLFISADVEELAASDDDPSSWVKVINCGDDDDDDEGFSIVGVTESEWLFCSVGYEADSSIVFDDSMGGSEDNLTRKKGIVDKS